MQRRRRNALEPGAWIHEKHRFDIPGERADIRLGVHATENFDTAIAYAVHKASQEGDLQGGEPNCGIVFTLDVEGLTPLPEADALIISKDERDVVHALKTTTRLRDLHPSEMAEELQDFMDGLEPPEYDSNIGQMWFQTFWEESVWPMTPFIILPVLVRLAEDDPHDLARILRAAFTGKPQFPLELWAEAIGQYRYMEPVGFDRLLQVHAVHPVNPELINELRGNDDDDQAGPISFVYGENLIPPTKLLWDSGVKADEVQYHGTDISRAWVEFPEVAEVLVSPWPFGQPEGVGPA